MIILLLMSLTLILALIDIVIKFYVEGNIARGEKHEMMEGKVEVRKVYNKGFAFNLMEKRSEDVRVISAFVAVVLTIYQCLTLMRKKHFGKKVGLSLMVAGAWSNTFDRWVRKYVIDYIGFKTKWEKINRLTFNLGDFFLAIGAAFVALSSLFSSIKKR